MKSVFVQDGDVFLPQPQATAAWYDDGLHGGAVGALFARQIELVEAPNPMMVARLTIDLLRPVPARPLEVITEVVRPGKRIQLIQAVMRCEGVDVARAIALRTRSTGLDIPHHHRRDVPGSPEGVPKLQARPVGGDFFHVTAVEMRVTEGDFYDVGPATVWFRMVLPFLPGEEPTPLMRTVAFADFANGVSRVLSSDDFVFLNPELSIHLHRYPETEWVCLRSRTDAEPSGVALAQSELFDERGALGHGLQSLYVDTWEGFGQKKPEKRSI